MELIPNYFIKGVMDGDGSIDRGNISPRLRMDNTSLYFSKLFSENLKKVGLTPRWGKHVIDLSKNKNLKFRSNKRSHQYIVRATTEEEFVKRLFKLKPRTRMEKISYIKGFYLSEGCYSNYKKGYHYISFTNKNVNLLKNVKENLKDIGIIVKNIYNKKDGMNVLVIYKKDMISLFDKIIGLRKK